MVGLHLRHGIWSAFQTLGWANRNRYQALRTGAALVVRGPGHRLPRAARSPSRSEWSSDDAVHRRRRDRSSDAKAPDGSRSRIAGRSGSSAPSSSTRPTSASSTSSWSAPAWPAAPPPRRWASSATTSSRSATRTRPRRAHSIAAQGGINAAKNYRGDGDSIYRLFYDTVKGGDFRSRESNVYRLAQVSREHHRPGRRAGRAVRPRVRRTARHPLLRRRPGLPYVLRPRPDGPAAAARRLPGAGAADRGRDRGDVHPARDARPDRRRRPGARHHRPRHGHRRDRAARGRRRRARHRRLRQRVLPVHERQGLQHHGDLAGARAGRVLRQPLLHPDPPDLHPGLAASTSRS